MAIKSYKPTSAGRRHQTCSTFEEITTSQPERSLVVKLKKTGGRNNFGRITSRHIGGGHKQKYRIIDFRRDKRDIPAKVASVEYDPYRSARIALLNYVDGEKRYIIAPLDLKVGDTVVASTSADIKPGNALPIRSIPLGTIIHNIELKIGKGAQLARSAGTLPSLWQRKKNMPRLNFLPVRCVWSSWIVWQLSGKWETWTTKMFPSARQVAPAGLASVLKSGALP